MKQDRTGATIRRCRECGYEPLRLLEPIGESRCNRCGGLMDIIVREIRRRNIEKQNNE